MSVRAHVSGRAMYMLVCVLLVFVVESRQSRGLRKLRTKSYMEALWEGLDVDEFSDTVPPSLLDTLYVSEPLDLGLKMVGTLREKAATASETLKEWLFPYVKGVQMLGPPDSGTNLWVKMVQLNWPDRVGTSRGSFDRLLWKHSVSNASDIKHVFETKIAGEHVEEPSGHLDPQPHLPNGVVEEHAI